MAPLLQEHGPPLVVSDVLVVLAPVHLDDQPLQHAREVNDVRADGDLPAELAAVQLAVAQA